MGRCTAQAHYSTGTLLKAVSGGDLARAIFSHHLQPSGRAHVTSLLLPSASFAARVFVKNYCQYLPCHCYQGMCRFYPDIGHCSYHTTVALIPGSLLPSFFFEERVPGTKDNTMAAGDRAKSPGSAQSLTL